MFQAKRPFCAGTLAVLAGAFTLFSALLAADAHSQSVCSVPGDHATIQAAVDDAACETVNVGAGTFYESVTISRTVTLQGQGEDLTIVEGEENDDYIFSIEDSGVVTLTGMTIQGPPGGYTGGILNDGATFVTGCTLSGNSECFGAGIFNRSGTMIVTGSTLRENWAYGCAPLPGLGGGIGNAGTMTVTDSTLSGNSAASSYSDRDSGGGIGNVGTMTLINSTLSGNSADSGGGVYNEGRMTLINSTLTERGQDRPICFGGRRPKWRPAASNGTVAPTWPPPPRGRDRLLPSPGGRARTQGVRRGGGGQGILVIDGAPPGHGDCSENGPNKLAASA